MEIPSLPTHVTTATRETALIIDKLQTGQPLQVKIVDQLANKHDVIIHLGNQLIAVKTNIPVTVGQTINVIVDRTPTELILNVKQPPQANQQIPLSLRHLLPKQTPVSDFHQPLGEVLAGINKQTVQSALTQSKELALQLLQLRRLANNIIHTLPKQKNITTAAGLKDAVQHSGVFLEPTLQKMLLDNKAALKNHSDNATTRHQLPLEHLATKALNQQSTELSRVDIKANLIKLIQLLNAWPNSTASQQKAQPQRLTQEAAPSSSVKPTVMTQQASAAQLFDQQIKALLNKTEGALSKITLNQLASSNIDNSTGRQTWQIEIPFLNQQATESVFLKIEQEDPSRKKTNETNPQWVVSLEMNPPKLGLIKNKLTLQNHQISSHFWAEQLETRQLIDRHLNTFKEQLNRANLKTDSIQLQEGPGPIMQNNKPSESILSEKA
ncbi:flagellar hook-length control protein FliK [Cycloclasticus pugetii]|uniref:flagellar hook-length control protein FliK n=1 Tax=Cycloclasticus pugetii TaxID=34068 RepID=UPI000368FB5B|nr:flagellar hook-length control protein FliK [Cycloclasticus pugetii]